MENGGRDSTQEWLLPDREAPPTVAELEGRIDEAVAIARASEAAALTIGGAAIESAEQARRAAELALRASESAVAAASRSGGSNGVAVAAAPESSAPQRPEPAAVAPGAPVAAVPRAGLEDDRMLIFRRRADRLGARFVQLQRR